MVIWNRRAVGSKVVHAGTDYVVGEYGDRDRMICGSYLGDSEATSDEVTCKRCLRYFPLEEEDDDE